MNRYFEQIINLFSVEKKKEEAWRRYKLMMPSDKSKFIRQVNSNLCWLTNSCKSEMVSFFLVKSENIQQEYEF